MSCRKLVNKHETKLRDLKVFHVGCVSHSYTYCLLCCWLQDVRPQTRCARLTLATPLCPCCSFLLTLFPRSSLLPPWSGSAGRPGWCTGCGRGLLSGSQASAPELLLAGRWAGCFHWGDAQLLARLAKPQDVAWIAFYWGFDLMLRISIWAFD